MESVSLIADVSERGERVGLLLVGVMVFLVIVGLVAYGIWELVRSRDRGSMTGAASAAMAVLDDRLARSEIEPEDYIARRDLLTGASSSNAEEPDDTTG